MSTAVPGAVVQLERVARGANVRLSGLKTTATTDHGAIRATELEVRVRGRFFDVDDFLFRMHRLVAVDDQDRPVVVGRLFATTTIEMTLVEDEDAGPGSRLRPDDEIDAVLKVVAFSSADGAPPAEGPVAGGTEGDAADGEGNAEDGDPPAVAESTDGGEAQ